MGWAWAACRGCNCRSARLTGQDCPPAGESLAGCCQTISIKSRGGISVSNPSERSSGGGAVAVISVAVFVLFLVCGGGLVLLAGGLFFARTATPVMAPPRVVQTVPAPADV